MNVNFKTFFALCLALSVSVSQLVLGDAGSILPEEGSPTPGEAGPAVPPTDPDTATDPGAVTPSNPSNPQIPANETAILESQRGANDGFAGLDGSGNLELGTIKIANTGANSIAVNSEHNTIEAGVGIGTIAGGGSASFPNRIGYAGMPNGLDWSPEGWATDSGYPANAAGVSFIGGGYDHIQNQIAGVIGGGGHNFIRYHVDGHSFIGGGSYNIVWAGRAVIGGGLKNSITSNISSTIAGGDSNLIKEVNHSTVGGGFGNEIRGNSSGSACTISGGYGNTIGTDGDGDSYRSTIGGGSGNSIDSSKRAVISGGQDNSIDNSDYTAILGGGSNTISSGSLYSFIPNGQSCSVENAAQYASAQGNGAIARIHGSINFTARQNDVAGDAQATSFAVSQKTTDATTKYTAVLGGASYAAMQDNSNWVGVVYLTGREAATGHTYSCKIDFSVTRHGDVESIEYEQRTTMVNTVGIVTEPAINLHSSGLFRVSTVGVAGKTINWSGRVDLASSVF